METHVKKTTKDEIRGAIAPLFAYIFLPEQVKVPQIFGVSLIILGIVLIKERERDKNYE